MVDITISRQYGAGGKTLGKMIPNEGDVVALGRISLEEAAQMVCSRVNH